MTKQSNNLLELPTKIIAIIAHEDDETSCGGLLAKNVRLGGESHVICFGGSTDLRFREFEESCKILGVTFELLRKKETRFDEDYSETIDKLSDIIIDKQPEFVITHRADGDYHRDHRVVSSIARESCIKAHVRKNRHDVKGILYTETMSLHPVVSIFIDITEEYDKVYKALKKHISQIEKLEDYYLQELDALTRLRGVQAGCERAEALFFEPLPLVSALNRRILGV
ncbi:MAG: PIG-L deacetylase family protein [archaeon]